MWTVTRIIMWKIMMVTMSTAVMTEDYVDGNYDNGEGREFEAILGNKERRKKKIF